MNAFTSLTNPPSLRRQHFTTAALAALGLGANLACAQVTLLHSFTGGVADGSQPLGTLVLSSGSLYGMASSGGTNGFGTIFKVGTDGGGFTLLHTFANGAADGKAPSGSLLISDSTIYGTTSGGGTNGWGTVFRMNTNGTGYVNLHSFANLTTDGRSPYGSVTLAGATLYGMTGFGGSGSGNVGTVFKVNTDGTGFALLHSFGGGATDGSQPFYGGLVLSGATLYGMTQFGGPANGGTIFKLNTDGTGFRILHSFAGGANDGSKPYDSLTLMNATLYGMTYYGGSNDLGAVFRINLDGTGYTNLHSFAGGANDGSRPVRSLSLSGSTLYGTTPYGGKNAAGVAFQINTNGAGFSVLHSFAGAPANGSSPSGSLTVAGAVLYGATYSGGNYYNGAVYSLSLNQTITATAGSHGTIQPTGVVSVPVGSATNFLITPDRYWHVADVTSNGVSLGAVTAVTWSAVTADGSINAAFAPDLAAGGTPHWWLSSFGWTNNFDAAEAGDTDGDGFTAGQEYLAGTDPTDASSALRILDMRAAPPQLTVLTAANRLYTLYRWPDLTVGTWFPVSDQTDLPGTGGLLTLIDSNAPAGNCFYRVSVRLP